MDYYSRISDGKQEKWFDHATAVYENLKELGVPEKVAYVLGYGHDLGKLSKDWQDYLQNSAGKEYDLDERKKHFVEHKTHGAKMLCDGIPDNSVLSRVVFSHHGRDGESGIKQSDGGDKNYKRRITLFDCCDKQPPVDVDSLGEQEIIKNIKEAIEELPRELVEKPEDKHESYNIFRWYLACLTWADWTAAADFGKEKHAHRKGTPDWDVLLSSIEKKYDSFGEPITEVARIREDIKKTVEAKYSCDQGEVYKLSIPTGGGKTLATMNWAIRHAKKYGKKRIVVVIPFTRIIKQTSEVYRSVFGDGSVLESHGLVELKNTKLPEDYSWGRDIVVTTDVSFFGSWYTTNNRKLMRFLNLENSVIIFDECQWIPINHMLPCTDLMRFLTKKLSCTILLTTATMPEYEHDGISNVKPKRLMSEEKEKGYYEKLRRVDCQWLGVKSIGDTVYHYCENHANDSALFIVNSTAHCRSLYDELSSLYGDEVYHLSKKMTAEHISEVLSEVTDRLRDGKKTILVSTTLIEAGVDVSFKVVYRSRCGLDSLAQSAGRCNRNGELDGKGKCYLYDRDFVADDAESEKTSSFWHFINNGFEVLKEVYDLKDNETQAIDIYNEDNMQKCYSNLYSRYNIYDEQGLLRGNWKLKDIELIDDRDAEKMLIVNDKTRKAVEKMLKREEECENFRLTPFEEGIIRKNTVEFYVDKEARKDIETQMKRLENLDIWVLFPEMTGVGFVYDEKKGLIEE